MGAGRRPDSLAELAEAARYRAVAAVRPAPSARDGLTVAGRWVRGIGAVYTLGNATLAVVTFAVASSSSLVAADVVPWLAAAAAAASSAMAAAPAARLPRALAGATSAVWYFARAADLAWSALDGSGAVGAGFTRSLVGVVSWSMLGASTLALWSLGVVPMSEALRARRQLE